MNRPRFLDDWEREFERRNNIRHRMMRRLKIALPEKSDVQTRSDLLLTIRTCAGCAVTEACHRWLHNGGGPRPPGFCPAYGAFLRMMPKLAR